ncbi:hypothetical protein LCGC14_1970350 [marine sediment metagenome]|uniref:Uncharacterized protein n=1 Tax=marine sediment metagenome TaxID=412755 RepID=A0A0F9FC06_9ZZZZ
MEAPFAIRIGADDTNCVLGAVESEPSGAGWAELMDMAEHIEWEGAHGG